jgi:ectoine hydroxylase-related dioxygenase (phytanoyl-CoA dioxygenase family)
LRVTPQERRAWTEEGFFTRERAFSPHEIRALGAASERCAVKAAAAMADSEEIYAIDGNVYVEAGGATVQLEHQPASKTIRVIEPFHQFDPEIERLIDDPRIVEPMRDLVGDERIALFTDKLNLKRPREGSRFLWHQDSPYWIYFTREVDRLPNVMVALDDANETNGCFRLIRGSHKNGILPGRQGDGRLGPLFTHPDAFNLADQVPVAMPAGSLCFFSPHSVHGSEPNNSEALRRACVLTYQPSGRRMFKVDAIRNAG